MSNALSRRAVLKSTIGIPFILGAGWRAPEKPKIALIGCGGMGNGDASNAKRFGTIAAVCDVDATRAEMTAKKFDGAKVYHDFRKLLDAEKDISIIINATPDHWHTLVNLAALKAGKDVYSEKPLTLTIDEGKRLVAAVKELEASPANRQPAAERRIFRLACQLVRTGRLGKLSTVTSTLPAGLRRGPFKPSPVPKGLDWDMWQGQTPEVEYVTERCFTNFRFWQEYCGGTITDWGAHHNDIALWATGKDRTRAASVEGKRLVEPIPGGYTAVPEYEVTFTYADGVTHICTEHDSKHDLRRRRTTSRCHGPDSPRRQVRRVRWLALRHPRKDRSEQAGDAQRQTLGRGIEGVRQRRPHGELLRLRGVPQSPDLRRRNRPPLGNVCHLGGIALQLGRKLKWDPAKEEFVGDKEANGYVARVQRKKWSYEMV